MQLKRYSVTRLLVGIACALALMPYPAYAESAETPPLGDDFAEIVLQAQSADENDAFAPEEGYTLEAQADMPAFFDLRHVNVDGVEKCYCYVTPVRQQNPFGSCWGFGAIAAAESSLLSKGLVDDPLTLNLSEKQVVWYNAVALNDPSSPQNGEGMTFSSDVAPEKRYNAGGLTSYATSLFASGVGPTNESTNTDYGQIFYYSGLNREVVNDEVTWIDENGDEQKGFKKVYYSDSDDWSMPEAYRFWQDYQLMESYLLPSPADCKTDEDLAAAINAIKGQLLSYHAVAINFHAQTSQPGQTSQFNDVLSENWAQYDPTRTSSNHVVTIIGYDDNYPKGNFATTPPGDGAWLVKNSWGADTLEFPDNGYRHWGLLEGMDKVGSDYQATSQRHTGYFWLSYYDTTIRNPETYDFDLLDDSIIIDQHDFMSVTGYEHFATDNHLRTANVFVASQDEELKDISFMTATPGTSVSWRVYLLGEDATNPEDGTCAAFADDQEFALGGYHRVSLDEGVVLEKGQRYAVVVEQRTPSGKYSMTVNTSISYATSYNGSVWFEGVVNKGESYFFVDGDWRDLSDGSIREKLSNGKVSIDNFSIKAYASADVDPSHPDQPDPPSVEPRAPYLEVRQSSGALVTDTYEYDLYVRDTVKYRCTIKGATDDIDPQPVITWTASDSSVIKLTPNEDRLGAEAVIEGVNPGEVDVTVDAGIYGKTTIHIVVPKPGIMNAELADEDREHVYTGEPYEPEAHEVYVWDENDEQKYVELGKDYEVVYENNVLCGRGEMIVRGINKYGGEIKSNMWRDLSFLILPTKPQITSLTPGDGTITVQFVSQKESGISGYELSWREVGEPDDGALVSAAEDEAQGETMRLGADATSATIEGLKVGSTYEVTMRAYVNTADMDWDTDIVSHVDHFGEWSDAETCTLRASDDEDNESDSGKKSDSGSNGKSGKSSSSAKRHTLPRTSDLAVNVAPLVVAGVALVVAGLIVTWVRRKK